MNDKAWKVLTFALACSTAAWVGTTDIQAAKPEPSFPSGSSVAGIGVALDKFETSRQKEEAGTASLTQEKMTYGTFRDLFDNLGVAMVEDSLNIRKEPKNDGEIVGKMGRHAGCNVLSCEDGWYKVTSGPVTGYVYGNFLATGQAAREVAYYDMKLMLRVKADTLRVRETPDTDGRILGRIHEGETYEFLSENAGWVKIKYGGKTGYAYAPGNGVVAYTIPEAEKADSVRQKVVNYAVGFVGNRYQWGGTDPYTGADCSGFVQYVLNKAAGVSLGRTSRQQSREGQAIPASVMEPGDLLFYASGSTVDHVAMYIGDGKIVHAANSKSGIKISKWNYRQPVTIRRVLP